jgi:hypothetical protein
MTRLLRKFGKITSRRTRLLRKFGKITSRRTRLVCSKVDIKPMLGISPLKLCLDFSSFNFYSSQQKKRETVRGGD